MADYMMLGTLNVGAGVSVARHWTLEAAAKYNPFSYGPEENRMQNRQQVYNAGVRYWPWHVFSGWWISAKAQYQEYNHGGVFSRETREGDRMGAGLGAGYTYMVNRRLNLEFGLSGWAGWDRYAVYECPVCGFTLERGQKVFFLPNELVLALTYVF